MRTRQKAAQQQKNDEAKVQTKVKTKGPETEPALKPIGEKRGRYVNKNHEGAPKEETDSVIPPNQVEPGKINELQSSKQASKLTSKKPLKKVKKDPGTKEKDQSSSSKPDQVKPTQVVPAEDVPVKKTTRKALKDKETKSKAQPPKTQPKSRGAPQNAKPGTSKMAEDKKKPDPKLKEVSLNIERLSLDLMGKNEETGQHKVASVPVTRKGRTNKAVAVEGAKSADGSNGSSATARESSAASEPETRKRTVRASKKVKEIVQPVKRVTRQNARQEVPESAAVTDEPGTSKSLKNEKQERQVPVNKELPARAARKVAPKDEPSNKPPKRVLKAPVTEDEPSKSKPGPEPSKKLPKQAQKPSEDPSVDDEASKNPYTFQFSQNEAQEAKMAQKSKIPKKCVLKPKTESKMELLIQQQNSEHLGNFCNVQANPGTNAAQREIVEEQIAEQIDPPARAFANIVRRKSVSFRIPETSSLGQIHSKVWHSPQASVSSSLPSDQEEVPTFVSDSPPIQSSFALQMARQAMQDSGLSPYCETANLPKAFYKVPTLTSPASTQPTGMPAPRFRPRALSIFPGTFKSPKAGMLTPPSFNKKRALSTFQDSNAENLEPEEMNKSPLKKIRRTLVNRSPLKDLPIPESSLASFIVEDHDQTVTRCESLDIDELCKNEQTFIEKKDRQPANKPIIRFDDKLRCSNRVHYREGSPERFPPIHKYVNSTPMLNKPSTFDLQFIDASAIQNTSSSSGGSRNNASDIEDVTELHNSHRIFAKRKRLPQFTQIDEEPESSDYAQQKTTFKRKKQT